MIRAQDIVTALTDLIAERDLANEVRDEAIRTRGNAERLLAEQSKKMQEQAQTVPRAVAAALWPSRPEYATTGAVVAAIHRLSALAAKSETDGLSQAITRMNDVITAQIQAVGTNSGIARAADIRRRQVAEYPPEHDRRHGTGLLEHAAAALLLGEHSLWPWDPQQYDELRASGEHSAHAAALAAAAYDVQKAEPKA